jgi:hypothetical protein
MQVIAWYCGRFPQGGIASGDRASAYDLRSDRVCEAAVWSATRLGPTALEMLNTGRGQRSGNAAG